MYEQQRLVSWVSVDEVMDDIASPCMCAIMQLVFTLLSMTDVCCNLQGNLATLALYRACTDCGRCRGGQDEQNEQAAHAQGSLRWPHGDSVRRDQRFTLMSRLLQMRLILHASPTPVSPSQKGNGSRRYRCNIKAQNVTVLDA